MRVFHFISPERKSTGCNSDNLGELPKSTTYILFVGGFFMDLPETSQNLMRFWDVSTVKSDEIITNQATRLYPKIYSQLFCYQSVK